MRGPLLVLNNSYFFFGATVYVGTMWSLRFFFYPSWKSMNVDNVQAHFIVPTQAATRFFTVVVPLMFVTGVIMIVTEWGKAQLWQAIVAVLGLTASTLVGRFIIIPINQRIAKGVDQPTLVPLLERWMLLNDTRFATTTVMWLATLWYFVGRGHLTQALKH